MKKNIKIFVSYDYDRDCNYKELLNAWSKNNNIDLKFKDKSTDVSIASKNKSVIKRKISENINKSDMFICLVGKKSHASEWIDWEIEKACELNKKIIGVYIDQNCKLPENLEKYADSIISFKLHKIEKAINGNTFFENNSGKCREQNTIFKFERYNC